MDRYSRDDVAVVMYHLHIPAPDPMTNPSTEIRAEFCGALGTPSYAIDGKMNSGGGDRDETKSYYKKLNTQIENKLEESAEARILIDASYERGLVYTKVTVDEVRGEDRELRLQIALVEKEMSYSGQNNIRFHPMVVRSLGGEDHSGFPIDGLKKNLIEHTFDLEKITWELKTHLDDFEKEREITFAQKMHEIDRKKLSVVAFVEDRGSKQVLQSAHSGIRNIN